MRLGVDLGGTKIEAVSLGDDGSIIDRKRIATPRGDYEATIREIRGLVEALAGDGNTPVGVGTPGSESPATGLMRNANSTILNGRRFSEDLAQALGRRVRLANDADCFALAEARAGAGVGFGSVFGVILGTGVGGGIVVDGKVLGGPNRIAGEWGHNPLPAPEPGEIPGPECYCGRRGCIETWCSGPGLEAEFRVASGLERDTQEIAELARSGDPIAARVLGDHAGRLARALAGVMNIVDPAVVVLGGGLSNLDHLYEDLPARLMPHLFSDCLRTPIVRNRLGDSAGVIGAAWLWP
ncbi:ROK family protein [Rhodobacteraceae bacterium NNCM2]|nr:ROK family protein [Coraliihabitans acroporae]